LLWERRKAQPCESNVGCHPCGQDQGGSSEPFPNAFQMSSLNERGKKKKDVRNANTEGKKE